MSSKKNENKEEPEATSTVEHEEHEEQDDENVDVFADMDLPENVLNRVKGLRKLHESYEAIEKEYKEQRLALEKQFLARKEALYNQRSLVVKGESEISEEGVLTNTPAANDKPEEKGVPSFWLTALSSHPAIGQLITEEDVPALEALANVTSEYNETFSEFTLSFHFNENEFFSNTVLTKKYYVEPDLLDDKSPALMKIDGTEIQWKASKNLCVKEITKKQKAKGGRNKGQVRTVTRTVPKPSFFHYFDEPKEEEEDEEEPEENEDEDQLGRIKFNLDEDYDIGHIIRTSIIPEAILWFTGEAEVDDGMFDDEDDEDEDGEGDDDEEEGDEEDDEEGDAPAPAGDKKKNKNKGGASNAQAGSGEKPPECKQN